MSERGKRISWVELYRGYLWLVTAWVTMCAALTTRASQRGRDEELERYLAGRGAAADDQPG